MAPHTPPLPCQVSCHRHHHLHCDTPLDPHSPYEGFWWSHMGWLLDDGATQRRIADRSNVADMADDPFYQVLAGCMTLGWLGLENVWVVLQSFNGACARPYPQA